MSQIIKISVDEENQYWEFEDEELRARVNTQISRENPHFKFLDRIQKEVEQAIEKEIGKNVEMRAWDGYDVIGEYDLK